MKHKKVFIIFAIILVVISTIVLNKILATDISTNPEERQIGGIWYSLEEISEEDIKNYVDGKHYEDIDDVKEGVYRDDLENYYDVFCMDTDKYALPYRVEAESKVYKVINEIPGWSGANLGRRYIYSYKNGDSTDRSTWGKNAVEGTMSDDGKKMTVSSDMTSSTHSYYSRRINKENIDVNEYSTSNSNLDYDLTYVLTQVDDTVPDDGSVDTSHSVYQNALWKIIRPDLENEDGYSWYTLNEEAKILYHKAKIFKTYRDNFQKPTLSIPENSYTYKYIKDGDYFIAGPLEFNYGNLVETDDAGYELEVARVEKYTLIGKGMIDGQYTDVEITEFEFTDEEGDASKISLNETKVDENGETISYKFPKSGETFYLKILNTDPIYKTVQEISCFDVSFKYLDAEAKVWKITQKPGENSALEYFEWIPGPSGPTTDHYWERDPKEWGDMTRAEIEALGGQHGICQYETEDGDIEYYDNLEAQTPEGQCIAPKPKGKYDGVYHQITIDQTSSRTAALEASIFKSKGSLATNGVYLGRESLKSSSDIEIQYYWERDPEEWGDMTRTEIEALGGQHGNCLYETEDGDEIYYDNSNTPEGRCIAPKPKGKYDGVYHQIIMSTSPDDEGDEDDGDDEGNEGNEGDTTGEYYLENDGIVDEYRDLQGVLVLNDAKLYWREYKLSINFEKDVDEPTYIDIGGKVWVDMPSGDKTNDENGIYEENTNDYGRQNVEVQLFFEDGTPVKVGINTLRDGTQVEVINEVDGEVKNKLCDATAANGEEYRIYTDADGNYMFYYLPTGYRYYVEFVFDGSTYEIVEYLSGGSESNYKTNPNASEYDNNSKVKDEASKVTANAGREAFVKRFQYITYVPLRNTPKNFITEGTSYQVIGDSKLKYYTAEYNEDGTKYIRSKIITTTGVDEENFKTLGQNGTMSQVGIDDTQKIGTKDSKPIGQAIYPHQIKVSTDLIYPFDTSYTMWSAANGDELEYLQHINLGLKLRTKADFALTTQVAAGAMTIKDKEKVVVYKKSVRDDDFKIDGTNTQEEYIEQEISASDYNWKEKFTGIYGEDGETTTGYVVSDDRLNVYVLYRIVIQDQCEAVGDENDYAVINEIVDHFDNRLEMVPNNEKDRVSKLFSESGFKTPTGVTSWIDGTATEIKWEENTLASEDKYTTIRTTDEFKLEVGKETSKESTIYLILKVKENGDILHTGTDDKDGKKDGLQNIAEISSYSVYTKDGAFAGKIDKDSAPGNADPGDINTYEDDTDLAPMFRLIINWEPRKISGNVWEDLDGDAIKDDSTAIKNVKVDLIEYVYKNGNVTPVVRPGIKITKISEGNYQLSVSKDDNVRTDESGNYEFYVEGGNYAIRFTYGDTVMLTTQAADKTALKKYNAQDYYVSKPESVNVSGTYYYGLSTLPEYNQEYSRAFATETSLIEYLKDPTSQTRIINLNDYEGKYNTQKAYEDGVYSASNTKNNNKSNGREKAEMRVNVIENAAELIYEKANLLNKLSGNDVLGSGDANALTKYTEMEALSDIVVIDANDILKNEKVINLGLEKRIEASVALTKEVTRIVLKSNDGVALIDTDDASRLSNLQKLSGDIQNTYLNLETRLMDGATIDIYYSLKVENDAQGDDRLINYVYSDTPIISDTTDRNSDGDTKILTKLMNKLESSPYDLDIGSLSDPLPIKATVFDYVNRNLEYRAEDNKDDNGNERWGTVKEIAQGWLSEDVLANIPPTRTNNVSKIIRTTTEQLTAGTGEEIPVHLGITLSEDTSGDEFDFYFSNCAEVVQIYSGAGRRDYETIPGNYVPYDDSDNLIDEPDDDLTGSTAISSPLGQQRVYYVITVIAAAILIGGIIFIKKKVLKK